MKNRTFLILTLALVFFTAACSKAESHEQEDSRKTVTIFHYNVGAFGKTTASSVEYIANMIKETPAEFISLNEVDSCNTRHSNDQLQDMCRALGGWNGHFAKAMDYKSGGYGVAVASAPKHKVRASYTVNLDKGDGSEPRAAAVQEFDDIVIVSTHLDHKSAEAQLNQAKQLNEWLMKRYSASGKKVFLCGDFNAVPSSATIQYMIKAWTILSPLDATISALNPTKCIDYIMVLGKDPGVKVVEARIMKSFHSGDVKLASDHLPLFAKIEIE